MKSPKRIFIKATKQLIISRANVESDAICISDNSNCSRDRCRAREIFWHLSKILVKNTQTLATHARISREERSCYFGARLYSLDNFYCGDRNTHGIVLAIILVLSTVLSVSLPKQKSHEETESKERTERKRGAAIKASARCIVSDKIREGSRSVTSLS